MLSVYILYTYKPTMMSDLVNTQAASPRSRIVSRSPARRRSYSVSENRRCSYEKKIIINKIIIIIIIK